jgi:hypothetical protein
MCQKNEPLKVAFEEADQEKKWPEGVQENLLRIDNENWTDIVHVKDRESDVVVMAKTLNELIRQGKKTKYLQTKFSVMNTDICTEIAINCQWNCNFIYLFCLY